MKNQYGHYLYLNGYMFVENKNIKLNTNLLTLFECYGRPSRRKYHIYKELIDFVRVLSNTGYHVYDYGINSFNTSMFTFQINIEDMTTKEEYLLHITPRNMYFKKLN